MIDPHNFSVDQQIQIWNVAGTWLAAIATFAAVLVSLYLARKGESIELKCTVGVRLILTGNGAPPVKVIELAVVNIKDRPVTISNIGWSIGKGKTKRESVQLFLTADVRNADQLLISGLSRTCPALLQYGERGSFLLPLGDWSPWLEQFVTEFCLSDDPKTLRVNFWTTTGHVTTVKPEAAVIDAINRHLVRNKPEDGEV